LAGVQSTRTFFFAGAAQFLLKFLSQLGVLPLLVIAIVLRMASWFAVFARHNFFR
jgi:hypothetical protein